MDDPYESGFAKPVAPAWQPMMWFGAEMIPVAMLLLLVGVVVGLVPSFPLKIVAVVVAGSVLALLRYIGSIDNRWFSSTLGFNDRKEYIASATVDEFRRDENNLFLGFL